jgi:hypothetical protein
MWKYLVMGDIPDYNPPEEINSLIDNKNDHLV